VIQPTEHFAGAQMSLWTHSYVQKSDGTNSFFPQRMLTQCVGFQFLIGITDFVIESTVAVPWDETLVHKVVVPLEILSPNHVQVQIGMTNVRTPPPGLVVEPN
jgi:hypothetical protein